MHRSADPSSCNHRGAGRCGLENSKVEHVLRMKMADWIDETVATERGLQMVNGEVVKSCLRRSRSEIAQSFNNTRIKSCPDGYENKTLATCGPFHNTDFVEFIRLPGVHVLLPTQARSMVDRAPSVS